MSPSEPDEARSAAAAELQKPRVVAEVEGETRRHAHFDCAARYWRAIYDSPDLTGIVYQQRMDLALAWLGPPTAPARGRALDVGCGAGLLSIALTHRGYKVDAIDSSPAMVELVRQHAIDADLADVIVARTADAHALPFPDACYDVVVALGVVPWVQSPTAALAEMARVLEPGGTLIVSADNRARLNRLLDPRLSPFLYPVRRLRRALRDRDEERSQDTYRQHWPSAIDSMLHEVGLTPVRRATVGFGPFSFLDRPLLDESKAIALHRRLQRLADCGVPGLRGTGTHVMVKGRRPATAA